MDNNFQTYLRNEIHYPELSSSGHRFIVVPLAVSILDNGELYDLVYANHDMTLNEKYHISNAPVFLKEAKRLIRNFKDWEIFDNGVKNHALTHKVKVNFFYHKEVFNNPELILNPDQKAYYEVETDLYQRIINGNNGCDGFGYVLAIIDKYGQVNDIECVECHGKTNCDMVKATLLKLGDWLPAKHDGENVDSQICLPIYT